MIFKVLSVLGLVPKFMLPQQKTNQSNIKKPRPQVVYECNQYGLYPEHKFWEKEI